jgi:carbon monoxide dehydrogenase subunit G
MKITNVHERTVAADPGQVTALISDFTLVWPTDITAAPRPVGPGLYQAGPMLWQEIARPGAARAFRVTKPAGMHGQHWFEVTASEGTTLLRHTVDATATGVFAALWRARIGSLHDQILEALLDKVERSVASA